MGGTDDRSLRGCVYARCSRGQLSVLLLSASTSRTRGLIACGVVRAALAHHNTFSTSCQRHIHHHRNELISSPTYLKRLHHNQSHGKQTVKINIAFITNKGPALSQPSPRPPPIIIRPAFPMTPPAAVTTRTKRHAREQTARSDRRELQGKVDALQDALASAAKSASHLPHPVRTVFYPLCCSRWAHARSRNSSVGIPLVLVFLFFFM